MAKKKITLDSINADTVTSSYMTTENSKVAAPAFGRIVSTIGLLPTEFGREDLNQIARKINELIAHVSA